MNSPFQLNGKKILVTGASSGIGRSVAVFLSEMGAELILTARREQQLKESISLLKGGIHSYVVADLLKEEDRNQLINSLSAVDGVVFSAGKIEPFPVKFLSKEKLDSVMDLNFSSTVLLAASLLRSKKINDHASMVFISSFGAHHTYKGGAAYAASKLGVEAFAQVIAQEHGASGIRCNCVAPAMVKTEVYEETERQISAEKLNDHIQKYPLGVGYPEDVAHAISFLLSPASRWITGQTLFLDGGLSLGL